jgi:ketosteroid isomerase-like protein
MNKALPVLFALLVFGSSVVASRAPAQERISKNSKQETLLETDIEFAKASVAKGAAEAFAAYLADDAMQMPAGGNPVVGKKAFLEGMGSGYVLSWEPKKAEVAKSGELGWTWGTYELHTKDAEGKPVVRYGKYVNVWRKQKDGRWRVILDMGNTSPAPAEKP